MFFSDIHFHGLYGVDDGAASADRMRAMIDTSYADGVRFLCFTPHYNPMIWGANEEKVADAFGQAQNYCEQQYADLKVILGNELRYSPRCIQWIKEHRCRTMGDTRYILIDFDYDEECETIVGGVEQIFNFGYRPILAHAERYVKLHRNMREVLRLRQDGALIQLDTQSITGEFGFGCKSRAKKILSLQAADIVSSDAHGMRTRPPGISRAYQIIRRKYGEEYAEELCRSNAMILNLSQTP